MIFKNKSLNIYCNRNITVGYGFFYCRLNTRGENWTLGRPVGSDNRNQGNHISLDLR